MNIETRLAQLVQMGGSDLHLKGRRAPIVRVDGALSPLELPPERTGKIAEVIKEGGYYGMQTFDQSLMSLLMEGLVSMEDARAAATSPHDFALALAQARLD